MPRGASEEEPPRCPTRSHREVGTTAAPVTSAPICPRGGRAPGLGPYSDSLAIEAIQIRLQLPGLAPPVYQAKSRYNLDPAQVQFADPHPAPGRALTHSASDVLLEKNVHRWVGQSYARQATSSGSARLL